ncbi:CIA30 family protein [Gramella lutea]|uniref:CIA30 family protein n=1 Tax=Christiangramia lutea TaxID=1607951 RepID=A0A9X2A9E0_9FLAO|nr:CIA30 family protein [Christiangramia lutea]MCH4823524.1 CIA30 family protein [Christiangramia lutea]
MKKAIFFLSILTGFFMESIFDFNRNSNLSNWTIVEDRVMGGVSTGEFFLNEDGHAVFTGTVSLENNGGFVSVDYDMPQMEIGENKFILVRLKGDGKNYQLRIKNDDKVYYSYDYEFETTGKWQEVKIPISEMSPTFRGKKLNKPDFNHSQLDQITFLISNKRNEDFQLLIDKIELE